MNNYSLLLEENKTPDLEQKIKHGLKFDSRLKGYTYNITSTHFTGEQIREVIGVINFFRDKYKNNIPLHFICWNTQMMDKLVYIILEVITYCVRVKYRQKITYDLRGLKDIIWSAGIKNSLLLKNITVEQFSKNFNFDIKTNHYRKVISSAAAGKSEILSVLMQDIIHFLKNNQIKDEYCKLLGEVLTEIVGNACEHGLSDCLLDIDVTQAYNKKGDDKNQYYGVNVAVLNCSSTLFYMPLKERLTSQADLGKRYALVKQARLYHQDKWKSDKDYLEADFYTISSFQHKISGSTVKPKEIGGTGLTQLIESLESYSDNNKCYMLSGKRIFFFRQEYLKYNNDKWIGFNKENDYFKELPDPSIFETIKTFFPGTAYNLSFAFMK